ncbi:MAG TPA: phage tail length tape measure family protein, partial [Pseudorhodoferax sp.]|nr:phage tail length tape measure family protein [Pseudorhodoferax sp.]
MSELGKIQAAVEFDTTQADQALVRVEQGAQKMAKGVTQAGDDAAAGIRRVGDGAEESAQKTSRAASSISAAIKRAQSDNQRLIVEAQGYAKGSAEGLEELARRRGVDTAAMQDQFKALRQVRSEYDTLVARQKESAGQALFERQHEDAKRLVQDASYVRMWTEALEQKEAAERASASQTAFIDGLRKQSEAIGKSRADLLEMQATQMGLSAQAAPYIAQLRASERGIAGIGVSAGQTAAALRQLPAQFSDIVVSLQSGQAPLTVFLQQGSQIKDSFGGAGEAAKALGGYVVGLVNPLTIAATGVIALTGAYYLGSQEVDTYRKAIVLSGNAAGVTVGQMQEMARSIGDVTGSQAAASQALAAFATEGRVGADNLREFTQVAVEFARVTGQSVQDIAKQFGELRGAPLDATVKLNESMNFLTESTYRQIKALDEQGKTIEAANLAQKTYADTLNSRKDEIVRNLGDIEKIWRSIKREAGFAWDAMLNIGRPEQLEDRLAKAKKALDDYVNTQPGKRTTATVSAVAQFGGVEGIKREIAGLNELIETQRKSAEMEKERTRNTNALIQWDKEGDAFKTKAAKRDEEILRAQVEGQTLIAAGREYLMAGLKPMHL